MNNIENLLVVSDYFRMIHLDSPDIQHEILHINKLCNIIECLNSNFLTKICLGEIKHSVHTLVELLKTICYRIVYNEPCDEERKHFQEEYEKLFANKSENEVLEILKQHSQILCDEINKAIQ